MEVSKKIAVGAMIVIVAVGIILRAYHLGSLSFRADEFLDINATVGYAQTGKWQAWDHNMGAPSTRINPASDARAWLYRWQVAQLFRILPPTEAVARSVSVAWGVVMIIATYFLAYVTTRRRTVALVAAALVTVSPSMIAIDRTLRMYAMFVPIFVATSIVAFMALTRTPRSGILRTVWHIFGVHPLYGIGALSLAVIAFHLHPLAGILAFIVAFFVLARVMNSLRGGKSWRDCVALRTVVWGISIVAIIALFVPDVYGLLFAGLVLWEDHWSYLSHILAPYAHPAIAILLFCGGTVALARCRFAHVCDCRAARHGAMWIGSTVFVIAAMAIFLWQRNVGPQYIAFIHPFIAVGVALGIVMLAEFLARYIPYRHVFVSTLVLAAILVPQWGYFFAENNTYHITSRSETPQYRKVFTYVKKHAQKGDVLIARNFRNYYWSGVGIKTFDFGSERDVAALNAEGKVAKITRAYVEEIVLRHPRGWFVFADNDEKFITKEAREYARTHFVRISHANIRGPISVYRWDFTQ